MRFDRRQFIAGAAMAALPTPLLAAAPRPLRVVTTNQRMPAGFLSLDPATLGFKYRTLHIVGAPATEIVLGFCGWAVPANIEIDAPEPHFYSKIAVEIGSQVVPVTFGGGRAVTIAGGVPYILSDPIRPAAFGLKTFARDTRLYVRGLGVAGSGRSLPGGTIAVGEDMRMAVFPLASAIDDIDAIGPLTVAPGSQSRPVAPGPCLVLGRFPPGYRSIICTGDSIADGAGDNARLAVGKGFFNRAAVDAQGLKAFASLNLTKFGSTAGTLQQGLGVPGAPGFAYRQALLGFGNVLVDQYGTNSLGASTPTAAAKVLEISESLWTVARAAGIQKIIRTTLLPRTTSATAFVDSAGQAPAVNWGPGESRDDVNAGFAAARAAGKVNMLANLLPAVSDPADSHKWMSNGTPDYATGDGTHPSSASARLMGGVLRTAYLGIRVS